MSPKTKNSDNMAPFKSKKERKPKKVYLAQCAVLVAFTRKNKRYEEH